MHSSTPAIKVVTRNEHKAPTVSSNTRHETQSSQKSPHCTPATNEEDDTGKRRNPALIWAVHLKTLVDLRLAQEAAKPGGGKL
jgi:hypothetical protein